eukprot:3220462-Prymnesium_polylepis.1
MALFARCAQLVNRLMDAPDLRQLSVRKRQGLPPDTPAETCVRKPRHAPPLLPLSLRAPAE